MTVLGQGEKSTSCLSKSKYLLSKNKTYHLQAGAGRRKELRWAGRGIARQRQTQTGQSAVREFVVCCENNRVTVAAFACQLTGGCTFCFGEHFSRKKHMPNLKDCEKDFLNPIIEH